MPTNFHVANFKNKIVDCMSGVASTNTYTLIAGSIEVYSGAQPATPADSPAGTLLDTVTIPAAAWATPSNGTAVLAAPIAATAGAAGTAAFARVKDSNGSVVFDTPVSTAGGGGGIVLSTLSLTNGGAYTIDAFSIRMPASLGTIKLNSDLRDLMVSMWTDTADAPEMGVSGTISCRSGAAPSSADADASGTLLGDIATGGTSPWNAASGGSAELSANLTATGVAAGTIGHVRWTKGALTLVGNVSATAGDFVFSTLTTTIGGTITLTSANLTFAV